MRDHRTDPHTTQFLRAVSDRVQSIVLQKDVQFAEVSDLLRQSRLLAAKRLVAYALREALALYKRRKAEIRHLPAGPEVTFVATQVHAIEGLKTRCRSQTLASSIAVLLEAQRDLLREHGGHELQCSALGRCLLVFLDPHDAVTFACGLQSALMAAPWPPELESHAETRLVLGNEHALFAGLRLQMGVATGDARPFVALTGGRAGYTGNNATRAQALADVALHGEVLVSEDTYTALCRRHQSIVPVTGTLWVNRGEHLVLGGQAEILRSVLPVALRERKEIYSRSQGAMLLRVEDYEWKVVDAPHVKGEIAGRGLTSVAVTAADKDLLDDMDNSGRLIEAIKVLAAAAGLEHADGDIAQLVLRAAAVLQETRMLLDVALATFGAPARARAPCEAADAAPLTPGPSDRDRHTAPGHTDRDVAPEDTPERAPEDAEEGGPETSPGGPSERASRAPASVSDDEPAAEPKPKDKASGPTTFGSKESRKKLMAALKTLEDSASETAAEAPAPRGRGQAPPSPHKRKGSARPTKSAKGKDLRGRRNTSPGARPPATPSPTHNPSAKPPCAAEGPARAPEAVPGLLMRADPEAAGDPADDPPRSPSLDEAFGASECEGGSGAEPSRCGSAQWARPVMSHEPGPARSMEPARTPHSAEDSAGGSVCSTPRSAADASVVPEADREETAAPTSAGSPDSPGPQPDVPDPPDRERVASERCTPVLDRTAGVPCPSGGGDARSEAAPNGDSCPDAPASARAQSMAHGTDARAALAHCDGPRLQPAMRHVPPHSRTRVSLSKAPGEPPLTLSASGSPLSRRADVGDCTSPTALPTFGPLEVQGVRKSATLPTLWEGHQQPDVGRGRRGSPAPLSPPGPLSPGPLSPPAPLLKSKTTGSLLTIPGSGGFHGGRRNPPRVEHKRSTPDGFAAVITGSRFSDRKGTHSPGGPPEQPPHAPAEDVSPGTGRPDEQAPGVHSRADRRAPQVRSSAINPDAPAHPPGDDTSAGPGGAEEQTPLAGGSADQRGTPAPHAMGTSECVGHTGADDMGAGPGVPDEPPQPVSGMLNSPTKLEKLDASRARQSNAFCHFDLETMAAVTLAPKPGRKLKLVRPV